MTRFVICAASIAIGLFFEISAVIGVYRFDTALRRMHAAALGDTMGLFFILLGVMVAGGLNLAAVAEFKRGANGGAEVKLVDRAKVLGTLGAMIGSGEREDPEALIRALEAAGEESADWPG